MKHILITEDDRFMANVCRQKFEKAGYQVAVASDGHEAVEQLITHPPDIVMLDLMLPEIDGLGVLRFLRSRESLSKLPVIVVSNSDYFSGVVQAAWEAGATHFLNKGACSPQSLVDEVTRILAVEDQPAAPPEVAAPAPPAFRKKSHSGATRVLIADDDKLIHGVLSFFLKQAGYSVQSAYDGRQALEMAVGQAPDLLVLDGMMPELDGYQVLERWSLHPTLSSIPVIMLTGTQDDQQRADAFANGAAACLKKPFSPEALVAQANHFTGHLE